MPKNLHRKDRRHHVPPSNDSTMQLLSGRNKTQRSHHQSWCKIVNAETFPRLGHYVVSSPSAGSVSLTQRNQSTYSSFSCQRQSALAGSVLRRRGRKESRARLSQSNSQAIMLNSGEFKEYLLLAVEEGKRRMGEWITSELERAFAAKREISVSDLCVMDWQPEKTVVIPQLVNIRYPWDSAKNTEWERWEAKTGEQDWVLQGLI